MLITVSEINDTANTAPNKKANPGVKWQVVHEIATGEDGEWCNKPDRRTTKGAMQVRFR